MEEEEEGEGRGRGGGRSERGGEKVGEERTRRKEWERVGEERMKWTRKRRI